MIFITQEQEISLDTNIQALYFYASWMLYHKKMMIMIEKIESKYKDIKFIAIDTDHFKGLCKRFSVDSIPLVLVMNNGQEVKRINGLVLTSAFKSAFVDICKSCNLTSLGENHE